MGRHKRESKMRLSVMGGVKRQQKGNKVVYNYKNDNFVITRGRQNVTSESTSSGLLTS